MTTKPTGGKWDVYIQPDLERTIQITSPTEGIIAETVWNGESGESSSETEYENALKICKAVNACYGNGINPESVPMMLEALKNILWNFEGKQHTLSKVQQSAIEKAQAAINAAQA